MKKSVIVSIHIIFWAIVILLSLNRVGDLRAVPMIVYLVGLVTTFLFIAIFYTFYFSFPLQFLAQHRYVKFLLITVLVIISVSFSYQFIYSAFAALNQEKLKHPSVLQSIIITLFWGGIGSSMRLVYEWIQGTINQKELKVQNANSELKLLKYQLNPHFLFNTLNNIDGLIPEKPDKASIALNKLSDIMRYVVYKNEDVKVPISDELKYIENYLSLQKLRIAREHAINYRAEIDKNDIMIAPMLFISFIENAFKHGSLKNGNSTIDISITLDSGSINFRCRNFYIDSIRKDNTNGIGLELISKRLELLYPQKHQLSISKNDNYFEVTLNIKLL